MQFVQLLHCQIVVAVHEPAGQIFVQRVGEYGIANRSIGCMPGDEFIPPGLRVEHCGPELSAALACTAGGGHRLGVDPHCGISQIANPEGISKPARRVDGEHEHPPTDLESGTRC